MKRGEIWTVAAGAGYAGKPRPAVIVQENRFEHLESIIFCPLTSHESDASLFRPALIPNDSNGLRKPCRVMVDKIAALPRSKVGIRIGQIDHGDMVRVNRALSLLLGFADTSSTFDDDE